jgi:uroporphyrinogen decarboxylase
MSHRDILEYCLAGNVKTRIPVALWRHFPVDDQSAEGLASATINFQNNYDFDLVKVTPASSFCLKDWGIEDRWRGASEGTRDYSNSVIHHPDDWGLLPILDPYSGYLGMQIQCLKWIIERVGEDTPVIQTIFNPLAQAKNLIGKDQLIVHLRKFPDALQAGLDIISETTVRFIEAIVKETSIDGVFYAVQHGQYNMLSESEFDNFCRVYDLRVLEPAQHLWLNMLHLHGEQVMFERVLDYPVAILNWHDRDTSPGLAEAREKFQGVLCGGLSRERSMVVGDPDVIFQEAQDAIDQVDGRKFILGTGCVTPITAPHANLLAARKVVEYI